MQTPTASRRLQSDQRFLMIWPVNLIEQFVPKFPAPKLTRRRIWLAFAVAVIADALQVLLLPFAWTFIESAVDVVAMILTTWILGFHLLLLPTFVVELVPIVDLIPTWTACVAAVIALRKRESNSSPAPPSPAKPLPPTVEI